MATPFPANLGDLQTMIGGLLNDPTFIRYSTTNINQYLDAAQDRFNREAHICRNTVTINVVSGTSAYAITNLTGTALEVLRATHKGLELIKRSKRYFDMNSDLDWTATTGTPTQYVIDLSSNPVNIIVYPVPTSNDSGNYLVIEYTLRHDPMVSATDTPFTAQGVANALVLPYAAGLAYEASASILEGDPTPEVIQKVKSFRAMSNQILSQIVQWYDRLDSDEPMRMMGGRNWHR